MCFLYTDWWFGTVFIFIIYGIILPIDKYFSSWLKPPTSIYIYMYTFDGEDGNNPTNTMGGDFEILSERGSRRRRSLAKLVFK